MRLDWRRILLLHDRLEGLNEELKVWDEAAVELAEADKLRYIVNSCGGRPSPEEVVFGHCGAIAIRAHVNADKLHSWWKESAFFQTQAQAVSSAHTQLAFHVSECVGGSTGPTEYVINNDVSVVVIIKRKTFR